MNRAVVVNSTWEALAECDLLARCLNEHSVALLRYHLEIIKAEVTRNAVPTTTATRTRASVGAQTSEPGTAGNGPGSDRSPVEAPMSETVASLSTPVKNPGGR